MNKWLEEKGNMVLGTIATLPTRMAKVKARAKENVCGENKAQGIIEYGLLLALVAIALISVVTGLKNSIAERLNNAAKGLN